VPVIFPANTSSPLLQEMLTEKEDGTEEMEIGVLLLREAVACVLECHRSSAQKLRVMMPCCASSAHVSKPDL